MLRNILAITVIAGTVLTTTPAGAQFKALKGDPEELSFGVISTESSTALRKQWAPFLRVMEEQVGVKIKSFFASDYAGVIEGLRFGKVHIALLGNKAAVEAVDRANVEVFVQKTAPGWVLGYNSVMISHVDNDRINTVEDVLKCDKSIDFGIGDPNSTSGFLVPSFYVFANNDVDPKACFKTMRHANHETNLMAVANKQVDAAVISSGQINRSRKKAPEAAAKLKKIWISPVIPDDPIVYRRDLSLPLKNRIKSFFLAFGRVGDVESAQKILTDMSDPFGLFIDSSNAQLYVTRQLILFKNKRKLEADDRMDSSEKSSKIKEIDDKLRVLEVLTSHK